MWETTPEEFRRVVNLVAAFLMTRAVLPTLLAQRWGRIINVTTSLDTMWRSLMQPYGGSKAANEAILTALAQELDGSGVTGNVLVPGGAADTRLVPRAMAPDRSQLIPPEVMVAPLIWLCSNGSDGKSRCAGSLAATRPSSDHAGTHALNAQSGRATGETRYSVELHGSNPEPLMSALGQKQTSARVRGMSALPPKADIGTGPYQLRRSNSGSLAMPAAIRRVTTRPSHGVIRQ